MDETKEGEGSTRRQKRTRKKNERSRRLRRRVYSERDKLQSIACNEGEEAGETVDGAGEEKLKAARHEEWMRMDRAWVEEFQRKQAHRSEIDSIVKAAEDQAEASKRDRIRRGDEARAAAAQKAAEKRVAIAVLRKDPAGLAQMRSSPVYGSRQDDFNCFMYLHAGVCKFGDRCAKFHDVHDRSRVLLAEHLFPMGETDVEMDPRSIMESPDVTEFVRSSAALFVPPSGQPGKLLDIVVSVNTAPYLMGNVYAVYSSEEAAAAVQARSCSHDLGGPKVRFDFVPNIVCSWSYSKCAQFMRGRCPRGVSCTFLHPGRSTFSASEKGSMVDVEAVASARARREARALELLQRTIAHVDKRKLSTDVPMKQLTSAVKAKHRISSTPSRIEHQSLKSSSSASTVGSS